MPETLETAPEETTATVQLSKNADTRDVVDDTGAFNGVSVRSVNGDLTDPETRRAILAMATPAAVTRLNIDFSQVGFSEENQKALREIRRQLQDLGTSLTIIGLEAVDLNDGDLHSLAEEDDVIALTKEHMHQAFKPTADSKELAA